MRRTKEDAEQTRDAILEAAIGVFSEKGVAVASLQEIADAAKVTRGAIYWHFKNKMEIFDALHERLYTPLIALVLEDLEQEHPEPLEQLKSLCIALLLELGENGQKQRVLKLFLTRYDYSGDLEPYREKHKRKKAQSKQMFSHYFERARAKGMLDADADPKLLTLAISCYLKGIVVEFLNDPQDLPMSRYARPLVERFFIGLEGAAPAATAYATRTPVTA